MARASSRVGLVLVLVLGLSPGKGPADAEASARQALEAPVPHESLGELHLLKEGAPPISGLDHVKVVDKDGRLALEGATSVVEASLALSAWHLGHGQVQQALKVVEAGLKEASKDVRLLGTAGAIALELGDAERALGLVEDGLKREPENDLLHFVRSRALSALGRVEESKQALEQAVRLAPANGFYQSAVGRVAYESGDYEAALRAFRAAVAANPRALAPASNLGLALLALGRTDEALQACLEVEPAQDDPNAATAFATRGAIYLRKQAWAEAERAYGDALALDPDVPGVAYNFAYLLYRRGELEGARESYERALAHRSDRPLAYLHLAEIAFSGGDAASAVDLLTRGETFFDPALAPSAFVLRGDSLRALGDLAASAEAYRRALGINPSDVPTQLALIAVLRLAGDLEGAKRQLAEARAQGAGGSAVLLEAAALARAEGDLEAEKATYLEILADEGETEGTWLVQLNLALILLRQGETADARKRLEPLLARLAGSSDSDTALTNDQARVLATTYGMLLAKEGVLEEARSRLQEVNRSASGFGPALQGLAVVAALGGDLDGAGAMLAELRGGSEASAMADGNLGLVLWLQGRDEEARTLLEAAREAYPEWTSVRAALASVALRDGRFDVAVAEASEAQGLCDSVHENPFGQSLPQNWLGVTLGGAAGLCDHVARILGAGLVSASLVALGEDSSGSSTVRDLIDRAMGLPLGAIDEARAHFVRGTLSLLAGAHDAARGDLSAALAGELDAPLRPLAENNLGVALHELGETSVAEQHFQNARTSGAGTAAATLNLGVVLDERNANAEALRLYQEYVSGGATVRRGEVLDWIENLKRLER